VLFKNNNAKTIKQKVTSTNIEATAKGMYMQDERRKKKHQVTFLVSVYF